MSVLQFKTNLNCGSCVAAVKPRLEQDPTIREWSVDTQSPDKILTVEGDGVTVETVRQHVLASGFRVLAEIESVKKVPSSVTEPKPSFWQTYRPLLLVLIYLLGMTAITEVTLGGFDAGRAMRHFMGGFFVAFSFFKLLDLGGFADAFQTYDIVARAVRPYALAYPFLELGLGIAYLTNVAPQWTNLLTLVVMSIGIVGVAQALLQRRQIRCACLGAVFQLPMSKVTFIEDGVMLAMAAFMLAM